MAFDFLPETPKDQPKEKPKAQAGDKGGQFASGQNYFFDHYNSHLDAHHIFDIPLVESQFNLQHNFDVAKGSLSIETLKRMVNNDDWFGPNTKLETLLAGYTIFQKPELITKVRNRAKEHLPSDLLANVEKKKTRFNDKAFGVFSFDMASMGMFYVYEYYNTKGQKVDTNLVEKVGEKYYFLPTKTEVFQQVKQNENGTPVVRSNIKKSYIDFEKKKKQDSAVEIFVAISFGANVNIEAAIYNALAATVVADVLSKKGIKVKVTSVLSVNQKVKSKPGYLFHFVPAKRFEDPLDENALAYVCGDPRFFRFQGFKMIIKGHDWINNKCDYSLGRSIKDLKFIQQTIENHYIPKSQRATGDLRLYFGGARNLSQSIEEVKKAATILSNKYGNEQN